jgi:hypothetical protein
MKVTNEERDEAPATVMQLAAALAALGRYGGANSSAEHAAEAARVGGQAYYHAPLANALLGIVEVEAMLADGAGELSDTQTRAAHRQALAVAGAEDDPARLLGFLRWRVLRVGGPLREMAQNTGAGPVPLAAAHAADGLQRLLAVCAAGQEPERADPGALKADLVAARQALTHAVANIDIMLRLLKQAEDLFSR